MGRFWGEEAAKVSRAQTPTAADPLPATLDLRAQLDKIGIDLLLVPVLAKAQISPKFIADSLPLPLGPTPPRLDAAREGFYEVLWAQGVKVLDLTPCS